MNSVHMEGVGLMALLHRASSNMHRFLFRMLNSSVFFSFFVFVYVFAWCLVFILFFCMCNDNVLRNLSHWYYKIAQQLRTFVVLSGGPGLRS